MTGGSQARTACATLQKHQGARWAVPLACAAMALFCNAGRAQQPVSEASVQSLLDALDSAPMSRSFTRTQLPDASTNLCAQSQVGTASSTSGSRNLEVVPYAGDSTAGINLDVQFGVGSDKPSVRDRKLLDNLAAALNDTRIKDRNFALAGHTDSSGSANVNLELSCARSLAVRAYLVSKGVAPARVTAYGFGSVRPLAGNPASSPQNRRVEVRMAP